VCVLLQQALLALRIVTHMPNIITTLMQCQIIFLKNLMQINVGRSSIFTLKGKLMFMDVKKLV
jgi:hypothetical protein